MYICPSLSINVMYYCLFASLFWTKKTHCCIHKHAYIRPILCGRFMENSKLMFLTVVDVVVVT